MKRNILTAILLAAAVFFYCTGQQTYAAWMIVGFIFEMAAIAIGTGATPKADKRKQSLSEDMSQ